jgi:predicted transcriptional regulator
MADPVVRLTVNVSPEVAQLLDSLAGKMRTTKTEALNQAIATMAVMYDAKDAGGEVVIKKGNTEQPINLPTK